MEDNIRSGWRTSSYTGNGGGNCVEVGDAARVILVRDTKNRTGPVLRFTPGAWRRFADRVKRSLAGPQPGFRGILERGAPLACPGSLSGRLVRADAGVPGGLACWIP